MSNPALGPEAYDRAQIPDSPYPPLMPHEVEFKSYLIHKDTYARIAKVVRINADYTIELLLDLGFGQIYNSRFPLYGVEPLQPEAEARAWLNGALDVGSYVWANAKKMPDGTYEVILAYDNAPMTINQEFLNSGYARLTVDEYI
jgi:hypothetical protein